MNIFSFLSHTKISTQERQSIIYMKLSFTNCFFSVHLKSTSHFLLFEDFLKIVSFIYSLLCLLIAFLMNRGSFVCLIESFVVDLLLLLRFLVKGFFFGLDSALFRVLLAAFLRKNASLAWRLTEEASQGSTSLPRSLLLVGRSNVSQLCIKCPNFFSSIQVLNNGCALALFSYTGMW